MPEPLETSRPSPDPVEVPHLHAVPAPPPVDLRVLQANERTLLAWIRTGLSLMAFGFVVARLGVWLRAVGVSEGAGPWPGWIGSAFVVLGMVSTAASAVRYLKVQRAIVEGRPIIPGRGTALSVAFFLVLLGGVLVTYLIVL